MTLERMPEICCICLDNLIIPVEPVCFKCRDIDGEISCFSMKRMCLKCAVAYLELDKHRADRPNSKKCVFCTSKVNLQQVHRNNLLRVDYMTMDQLIPELMCIFPECQFRGTHVQVARHIFTECPYYSIECECGHTCPRKDMVTHRNECEKYTRCSICNENILVSDLPRHMYYSHDKTKCFTCHQYIDMNHLSEHIISECPERLITCEICYSFIRHKIFKNHLRRHIVEINKNVIFIKDRLREEDHAYQRVQKLLDGFTATYPDEDG